MNTIAPHSLPSFVIIDGPSNDFLGHGKHNDNLKDVYNSNNESSNTVTTFFPSDDDYSDDDDSESCVSEFSVSTYNSSTSYIIELSGNCDPKKPQEEDGLTVQEEAKLYRTKPRRSVQRRMDNSDGGNNYESDEDSIKLLRNIRDLQDSNHSSWSDQILETMKDVDLVIVPLKDDDYDVGTQVDSYYKNHIMNKDSDDVECYSERVRRQGRRRNQDRSMISSFNE